MGYLFPDDGDDCPNVVQINGTCYHVNMHERRESGRSPKGRNYYISGPAAGGMYVLHEESSNYSLEYFASFLEKSDDYGLLMRDSMDYMSEFSADRSLTIDNLFYDKQGKLFAYGWPDESSGSYTAEEFYWYILESFLKNFMEVYDSIKVSGTPYESFLSTGSCGMIEHFP